jgi:hypothetical protein
MGSNNQKMGDFVDTEADLNIAGSLIGILVASAVWVVVSVLGHAAIYLFDLLRGLSDDRLQDIFRQLFTAGVGGYCGILAVNRYLNEYNRKFVFFGFCGVAALLFIASLCFIVPIASQAHISSYSLVMQFLSGVATIVGAVVAKSSVWPNP